MGEPLMRRAWLVVLGLLVGCTVSAGLGDPQHAGSSAEAEGIAMDWLAAVSSDVTDRGWSLLHPLSQERLYQNDPELYVADAELIEWSEFKWGVSRSPVWDGNYMLTISLPGSTAPAEELADGHLMQLIQGDGTSSQASITVRIDFDGSRGVLGP